MKDWNDTIPTIFQGDRVSVAAVAARCNGFMSVARAVCVCVYLQTLPYHPSRNYKKAQRPEFLAPQKGAGAQGAANVA